VSTQQQLLKGEEGMSNPQSPKSSESVPAPCEKCGSTGHTTGHHGTGSEPPMSPAGHHGTGSAPTGVSE
jgi:hypothetical protein